jgi:hypothetical protein
VMRIAPTLTTTGSSFLWDGTTGSAITAINASYNTARSVEHDIGCSSGGMVTGRAAIVYFNGATSTWIYSSEI